MISAVQNDGQTVMHKKQCNRGTAQDRSVQHSSTQHSTVPTGARVSLTVIYKNIGAATSPLICLDTCLVDSVCARKIDWDEGRGRSVPPLLLQKLVVLGLASRKHGHFGARLQLDFVRASAAL